MKTFLLRDFRFGILRKIWNYLFVLLLGFFLLLKIEYPGEHYLAVYNVPPPSAGDLFALLFCGQPPFLPGQSSIFSLPLPWMALHLVFFFLQANYITKDLESTGLQVILQSGGRWRWLFSKYIFGAVAALLFFGVAFLCALLSSLILGGSVSLEAGKYFAACAQLGAPVVITSIQLFLVPLVSLITLAAVQITAELYTNSGVAYLLCMGITVLSCYYHSPLLPGNGTMLLRGSAFGGIPASYSVLCCVGITALSLFAGWQKFRKKDLLY